MSFPHAIHCPHADAMPRCPERDLWAAVMCQAIDDMFYDGRAADSVVARRNAVAWIKSPGRNVGSFDWVCRVFDLNPTRARTKLLSIQTLPRIYSPTYLQRMKYVRDPRFVGVFDADRTDQ